MRIPFGAAFGYTFSISGDPRQARDSARSSPEAPKAAEYIDPVVVARKHYKVEFEDEKVRVLRIGYWSA